MTVKELRKELDKMPDTMEVILAIPINGVEFNASIEEVYESGDFYIQGKEQEFSIEDAKRWWGVKVIESEEI